MKITAQLRNTAEEHELTVSTGATARSLAVPPKAQGRGSSVNGGELLLAALATCFCNDIFREASKRGVTVDTVEVQVSGEFPVEGAPAQNLEYRVHIAGSAAPANLEALVRRTDELAEIQNTVREAVSVRLASVVATRSA